MNIATIEISGVYASAKAYTHIPAGLVGATVTFEFTDPRWSGLTKTAIFRGNVTRDVIMSDNVVKVPPETVEAPGSRLLIGVYGVDSNKNIVIPTLWTDIGPIRPSADPSGDPSVDPGLPVWAQLAEEIEKLKSEAPDVPGKPGQDGEDGGYYTPSLTQPDDNTLEFHFTPSKPDMPTVDPVQVELPNSGGDVDFADYIELLPEASYPVDEYIGTVELDREVTFIAGKTYLVRWNGVDYVRVAYEGDEVVLLGEDGDPFSVEFWGDYADLYALDDSRNVTLAIYEKAKYATEKWVEEKLKEHSGEGVFIAEYGVTANAEILEANESGKVCFAKYNDMLLPIASCDDMMTTFSGTNGFQFFNVRCNGEKWDVLKMPFTSTLSESSTNVEFPTAKAVVEYVKQHSGGNVDLTGYAKTEDIPTKVSELENDSGYLTEHQDLSGYVKSINGVKPDTNGNVAITVSGGGSLNLRDMEVNEIFTITGSGGSGDPDEPGEDDSGTVTGAVATNGRIIDIDMRNVQATDEYLIDTSGNENHMKLTEVGSASKDNVWTPTYYDKTANINKYVGAYTENTIDLSGDFTVEVFCEVKGARRYFGTLAPGWTGKDYAFEISGRSKDGTIEHISVGFTSQPKNYSLRFDDLTAIFLPGNFYHITVTRKGNDCSLYKNGEFVQTITLTSEILLNYRFYLCAKPETDGTVEPSNKSGAYKMLRAYNRALSASEIANHYSIELAKG